MATYAEMNTRYRDLNERGRYEMATREQAAIFSADGRPDIAQLGKSIVGGNLADVDSVIAAIVTGPNSATLSEDGSLLAAVNSVWPSVAAAKYGDAV